MGEMVERVALAIWLKRESGLPARVRRLVPDDLDRTTGAWAHMLGLAEAAILAMREPTEGMIQAAWRHTENRTPAERMMYELADHKAAALSKFRRRYSAMVDEALR